MKFLKFRYLLIFSIIQFISFSNLDAQSNPTVSELTIDEIKSILIPNSKSIFGSEIPEEKLSTMVNNNNNIYYFDLVYKGKTVYRDGIKKLKEGHDISMNSIGRLTYDFCVPYETFDVEDRAMLLEKNKIIIESVGNKKMIVFNSFEFIDKYNKDLKIIHPLDNILVIKFYKICF